MNKDLLIRKEYKNIKDLFRAKNYDALERACTRFLKKEKTNIKVRFMRAKAYRYLGKFDEAISDLEFNLLLKDKQYSLLELYYIYYHLNRYDDALRILPELYKISAETDYILGLSETVMLKEMGKPVSRQGTDYSTRQVLNYDEKLAYEHILPHKDSESKKVSVFNDNINFDALFEAVKKSVDNTKKANIDEILESHFFSLHNVGHDKGIPADCLKVVVIPNTNKIITMYPVLNADAKFIYTLNCDYSTLYKKEETEKTKVKKLSQIDKFNKRYGTDVK